MRKNSKLSRRELAKAAGILMAAGQAKGASTYSGPLGGFEDKVNAETFDPVAWTLHRHDKAPMALTFRAANRKQAVEWQFKLRDKITELIGGFPATKIPLQPLTLEVREFPAYIRERFIIETRPGVGLLAYLLTPKGKSAPHATVIAIPGHGRGVDDIVGIDEEGRERTKKTGYQYDFAVQAAEAGLAAVAIEPMAFGCRRDETAKKKGLTTSSCYPTAGSALLLGETMIGWRVYDVMRAVDWIETRKELDAKRIGCMGISGGGTNTLFAAALDQRIKAAFVSGYVNTFRDSIMSISHCADNYVPGILKWCEQYDVGGLIAPRPLIAESGDQDPIFPLKGSREGFARIRKVYEVLGASNAVEHDVFPGRHEFNGRRGIPFLVEHLKA